MTIESSKEAGSAWDKDQLAVKVRDRFDVQPVDTAAIIKGQITVTVGGLRQRRAQSVKDETKGLLLTLAKAYARIDYTDDDDALLPLLIEATVQSQEELIPGFDADNMTARQRLLAIMTVKNLYDNREKYGTAQDRLRGAASSLLVSEMYEDKEATASV